MPLKQYVNPANSITSKFSQWKVLSGSRTRWISGAVGQAYVGRHSELMHMHNGIAATLPTKLDTWIFLADTLSRAREWLSTKRGVILWPIGIRVLLDITQRTTQTGNVSAINFMSRSFTLTMNPFYFRKRLWELLTSTGFGTLSVFHLPRNPYV